MRSFKTDNDYILFDVDDAGIGIAQAHQEMIIDDFSQPDLSTSRKYGGTGLDLGICRQLIKLIDGVNSMAFTPNEESIFLFTVKDYSRIWSRIPHKALECV